MYCHHLFWYTGTPWHGACSGVLPDLSLDAVTYGILGASTAIKVALLAYCWALRDQSDSIMALAEDHSNDVVSNLGAHEFVFFRWCCRCRSAGKLKGVFTLGGREISRGKILTKSASQCQHAHWGIAPPRFSPRTWRGQIPGNARKREQTKINDDCYLGFFPPGDHPAP